MGFDEGFEALLAELMKLRPDLNREKLENLVGEKKDKVGSGFLTNQGALFLVSSDLGVALKPLPKVTKLSSILEEGNDFTIIARVLSIGAPRIFTKKSDSSFGFLAKIIVYDATGTFAISIWNKDVFQGLIRSELAPGDGVKITRIYARRTGSGPILSLSTSDQSEFSKLDAGDYFVHSLPAIDSQSIDLTEIVSSPLGSALVVKGTVLESRKSYDYPKKDGTRGHYVSLSLGTSMHESKGQLSCRVVLWENSNMAIEKIQTGETITLLNVKAKRTSYLGNEVLELHGDDTTLVLERWNECKLWLEGEFSSTTKELSKLEDSKNTRQRIKKDQNSNAFIARIMSIGEEVSGDKKETVSLQLLLVDSAERKISLTALGDSSSDVRSLAIDDVIVCRPDSFDLVGLKAICTRQGSVSRVNPQRDDIPKAKTLVTQIERIEAGAIITLDCMIISISPGREIPTKEGLVRRSEATLADPTGEIKLYAWRGLSRRLENLAPGVRLWLRAVEAQSHEGKKFLVYKNYSRIERVS